MNVSPIPHMSSPPIPHMHEGWLGQVPPAEDPPAPTSCPAPPSEPTYANPGLAPEPWKHDAPLFPDDPTLFG